MIPSHSKVIENQASDYSAGSFSIALSFLPLSQPFPWDRVGVARGSAHKFQDSTQSSGSSRCLQRTDIKKNLQVFAMLAPN